jgi:polar amino acid transport system substrate-binding protein
MTRMFSRIGCAFLIAALWLTGCAAPVEEDGEVIASTMSKSVLRVGVTANYPPLVDKVSGVAKGAGAAQEADKLVGIEIDLADEVGKGLDKRMEFVETPWEQLIPALVAGDIDIIMSGMSITAGRKQKISFTESYLRIGQMAITRISEIQKLGSLSALLNAPITVGFESGTTGESFVKTNMHNAKPWPLASIDAAVVALRRHEIDAFVHDAPTAWRIGSDPAYQDLIGLYWPLTEEYLAWGVRISDQALRTALNEQLAAMEKDGRLTAITRRWIKVRVEVR